MSYYTAQVQDTMSYYTAQVQDNIIYTLNYELLYCTSTR